MELQEILLFFQRNDFSPRFIPDFEPDSLNDQAATGDGAFGFCQLA